ncbi:flavodoxin [Eubacteriales bacterium OttesenSCG-928-M02]|nr:flavodoxin [Eubacteriales bacterium OttesenSCG-928-M02]
MKTRKPLISILILLILLVLAACGAEPNGSTERVDNTSLPSEVPTETPSSTQEDESTPVLQQSADSSEKVLVVYFSCTGNTKKIAEYAATSLNADLYAIEPEIPYTDADLNYSDNNSRSSIEMNDDTARPAIAGSVGNIDDYVIVFLAYPIWWGEAPKIICTFLESYDFSGKTIVPFCTSGGSGVGSSDKNLHELCSDSVTWIPGERFAGGATHDDVVGWINGLDLSIIAE